MLILLTGSGNVYTQFITVLIIFVVVLGITAWTTKWIANYQKNQSVNRNIQVIETIRIANNKYIQIVRIADKCFAIAVCKDTVTMLGEVSPEQIKEEMPKSNESFQKLLEKAFKKGTDSNEEK